MHRKTGSRSRGADTKISSRSGQSGSGCFAVTDVDLLAEDEEVAGVLKTTNDIKSIGWACAADTDVTSSSYYLTYGWGATGYKVYIRVCARPTLKNKFASHGTNKITGATIGAIQYGVVITGVERTTATYDF